MCMKKRIQITLDAEVLVELEKEFNVSALINALLKQKYKINGNFIHTKDEIIHTKKDEISEELKDAFRK